MSSAKKVTMRGAAVIAAFGLVSAACGGSDSSDGAALDPDADLSTQTLTISNWDAYTPEGLVESFESTVGPAVTFANHATNEEIVAKLLQSDGGGFDVVFVSGQFAQQLHEAGLLAEIDHDLIPNMSNFYPEALELAHDKGLAYSIPYTWGTTGLCYRSDLVSEAPTSWNTLLDPPAELDGKITMLATDRWLLLPAQKVLGQSVNDVDADSLAAVEEKLIAAKSHLLAYDDTTFYTRLVTGEASLVEAWDGWCNYGIAENPDIQFVVPEEGSDLWVDTMVILESSKNKEAAHAFINYVLEPANQQAVAELVLYKVPNKASMDALDPALIEQFPNLGMTPAELLEGEQLLDLGESTGDMTEVVTKVIAS